MPLYEYKCDLCGEIKQKIQRVGSPPLKCCGQDMERLIGSPALQFKGEGFYVNDYSTAAESKVEPVEHPSEITGTK